MVTAALILGAINSVLLFLVLAFAVGAFRALHNERAAHRATLEATAHYVAATAPRFGVPVPPAILRAVQSIPRA